MRNKTLKNNKILIISFLLMFIYIFNSFADTVEISNGMKRTFAESDRVVIDTIDKNYDVKWTLDKKGNWTLYLRRLNGRLIKLSNMWVNLERNFTDSNGEEKTVVDMYYFDYYENMVTGWYVATNGDVYFLNTDDRELGRMARGWTKIGNDYYYFNQSGVLQRNMITEEGFYVDENGVWK